MPISDHHRPADLPACPADERLRRLAAERPADVSAAATEALLDALLDRRDDAFVSAALERAATALGTLRARDDGAVGDLLAEIAGVGRWLDAVPRDPMRPVADLGPALERVRAAAANAFDRERARQLRIVLEAHDHALRGALNAIELARVVRRQIGRDTDAIVERQLARMRLWLDRHRDIATAVEARALRPAELPPDDLVTACRLEVVAWNESGVGRAAVLTVTAGGPVTGGFDAARLREALRTMLDVVAATADALVPIDVAVEAGNGRATLSVAAARQPASDPDGTSALPGRPLAWSLARQTANAHEGTLERVAAPGRFACRMHLAVADMAGPGVGL